MMETRVTQLPMTGEIASAMVAKRCLEDQNFLAKIKADPVNAFGKMPAGQQIRTVQNTSDMLHVCVPDYAAHNQLSDEQMKDVAGGFLPLIFIAAASIAGGSAAIAGAVAGTAVGIAHSQGAFNEESGMYDVPDP